MGLERFLISGVKVELRFLEPLPKHSRLVSPKLARLSQLL